MKTLVITMLSAFVAVAGNGQQKKLIKKSWIQVSSEDLSARHKPLDTSYIRYSFQNNGLNISLDPVGGNATRDWQLDNDQLLIGPDRFTIELLNDSALTISLPGFKRFSFLSETYLAGQDKNLIRLGDFEGQPLYKATNFISPRFSDTKSFYTLVTSGVQEHYDIKRKSLFQVSFIVTDKGEVKSINVEKSIWPDFDQDIIKEIAKTSKKWKPAFFRGQPIATKYTFKMQYLDSFNP